jgi:hypothetical protein
VTNALLRNPSDVLEPTATASSPSPISGRDQAERAAALLVLVQTL